MQDGLKSKMLGMKMKLFSSFSVGRFTGSLLIADFVTIIDLAVTVLIKSRTTKMILPIEKMSEKYFVCFRSQFLWQFVENSFCIPVAFSLS